jgi:hypothetical protein
MSILSPRKLIYFSVGAASCRDVVEAGPRLSLGQAPLPQGTNLLADKVALHAMTRYSAEVIIAEKAESRLKAFPTKTMLHWLQADAARLG